MKCAWERDGREAGAETKQSRRNTSGSRLIYEAVFNKTREGAMPQRPYVGWDAARGLLQIRLLMARLLPPDVRSPASSTWSVRTWPFSSPPHPLPPTPQSNSRETPYKRKWLIAARSSETLREVNRIRWRIASDEAKRWEGSQSICLRYNRIKVLSRLSAPKKGLLLLLTQYAVVQDWYIWKERKKKSPKNTCATLKWHSLWFRPPSARQPKIISLYDKLLWYWRGILTFQFFYPWIQIYAKKVFSSRLVCVYLIYFLGLPGLNM